MTLFVVDKGSFVVATVDDTARSLIKLGDTILAIGCVTEDGGDYVQVRFGEPGLRPHLWLPRSTIAVLSDRYCIARAPS
jgi:hypothetical protein